MAIDDPFHAIDKQYPKGEGNIARTVNTVTEYSLTLGILSGVPHLAVAAALNKVWKTFISGDTYKARTEATLEMVIDALRRQSDKHEQLDREGKTLAVKVSDLEASLRLVLINDGIRFDDEKRTRFINAIANATISPTKIDSLSSFIDDIDKLNERDITVLKVINAVMNLESDWAPDADQGRPNKSLHPNTFLQRAQTLSMQVATAFGKNTDGNSFSREEGMGICLRLQGFGLAEMLPVETRSVPITNYCARVTTRGFMLLRLLGETVPNWDRYFDGNGPR